LILITSKGNASVLGPNKTWRQEECETPTTSAVNKGFPNSAQTALLSTAKSVKLAFFSQQNKMIFA
jgi:hypothetical protein